MHVVIMGCGRVGSALALTLESAGHSVAVVDQDPTAFRRLRAPFAGQTVTGVGFDREVLVEAGIERADAFAAVSSGDNSNIIAARVARETFGVERVAARIYDPRRAQVYERLGIPTVATVRWTADQMTRRLVAEGAATLWADPASKLELAEIPAGPRWLGHRVRELQEVSGARIAAVVRWGEGVLPDRNTVVQDGDLLYVMVSASRRAAVERAFAAGPEEGSHG